MFKAKLPIVWRAIKAIKFKTPSQSRIAVLDNENIKILEKMVLNDIQFEVLPRITDTVFISPALLFHFIKNSLGALGSFFSNGKNLNIQKTYFQSCLDIVKPRVAITFIDNNRAFQQLSADNEHIDFFYIINGTRSAFDLQRAGPGHMTNVFGWGPYYADLYKQNGYAIDNYYSTGPLIGSYYKSTVSNHDGRVDFDICLVSQFRELIINGDHLPYLKQGLLLLDKYLARYAVENKRSLCIATCSQTEADLESEISYYRRQYGDYATIIAQDRMAFSTYAAMESSEVIVAVNSTAAYEAYSWGKKVLLCNFTGNPIEDSMLNDEISVREADYDDFAARLDRLLSMDLDTYLELTGENRNQVAPYDPDNPAHRVVRSAVLSRLEKR